MGIEAPFRRGALISNFIHLEEQNKESTRKSGLEDSGKKPDKLPDTGADEITIPDSDRLWNKLRRFATY